MVIISIVTLIITLVSTSHDPPSCEISRQGAVRAVSFATALHMLGVT